MGSFIVFLVYGMILHKSAMLPFTDFTTTIFLEQVPKISCLEKNFLTKKSMVYEDFCNKVAILPKRVFTLDLAEKPSWWKLFFSKVSSLSVQFH